MISAVVSNFSLGVSCTPSSGMQYCHNNNTNCQWFHTCTELKTWIIESQLGIANCIAQWVKFEDNCENVQICRWEQLRHSAELYHLVVWCVLVVAMTLIKWSKSKSIQLWMKDDQCERWNNEALHCWLLVEKKGWRTVLIEFGRDVSLLEMLWWWVS